MRFRWRTLRKWLTPGLGIKRWVLLLILGMLVFGLGISQFVLDMYTAHPLPYPLSLLTLHFLPPLGRVIVCFVFGIACVWIGILELMRTVLAPFRQHGPVIDMVYSHSVRQRGIRLVAIGGGTGLPSVLRGFKTETSNISVIVTVADDGGSSGKLRREFNVLPPGDLRNNIAALADDEMLMTQLFQYRFAIGGLEGHSFGNLFLTALTKITGSMEEALIEAGRVLAIQGRVLPSTLKNVMLIGEVRGEDGSQRIAGESQIPLVGGRIEQVMLSPENPPAYPEAIRAILAAELIVVGPGSLYTSIIPNLLVNGIPDALCASKALRIYVCNVATQEGETDGFTVADHVLAIERHAGFKSSHRDPRCLFDVVLANNVYPTRNLAANTRFVKPAPLDHPVRERYQIVEADLTDAERPWRHDPVKLRTAILALLTASPVTEE
ncbi:MAG TPA: uridine diphosphate-N-acetylglucosamine-binding protein YvcK [Aggregatilineaceae bacterium]|nr:uridine diphosphate-N-acetylglucosamine-binding protein YvcK [Aggregatilineaceae bacterium]